MTGVNDIPTRIVFGLPLILLACGLACFWIDLPVANFFHSHQQPRFLRVISANSEPFGHGIGVALILLTIAACSRAYVRVCAKAGLIVLIAGLLTDLIKFSYGRFRPRDLAWDQIAEVGQTFQGWMPFLTDAKAHHSFPSGHTTVAFALAVCLAAIFPHGRSMFWALAVLVGLGRIETSAHYPSDVCVGAAVGWTIAHLLIPRITWFDPPRPGEPMSQSPDHTTPQ